MTMTDLINSLPMSRATVYKRIREAGIDLDAIRDASGNIKPEYIQTIANLFDGVQIAPEAAEAPQTAPIDQNVEILMVQLEAAQKRITDLQSALDAARADADAWRRRSEADAARLDRLLPSGSEPDRRSWWQRITGRK